MPTRALYFLEISLHLKIPPPSNCCHMFLRTHPNKRRPQNLAAWSTATCIYICARIICAYKLAYYWSSVRRSPSLKSSCLRIVTALNWALKFSLWRDFKEMKYYHHEGRSSRDYSNITECIWDNKQEVGMVKVACIVDRTHCWWVKSTNWSVHLSALNSKSCSRDWFKTLCHNC